MINIEEIKKDYMLKNFLNYEKVDRNFNKIIEDKDIICRLFPCTKNIFKEIFDNLEYLEWKAKDYLDKRKKYKEFSADNIDIDVVSDFLEFVNFRKDLKLIKVEKTFYKNTNKLRLLCKFKGNKNMFLGFFDLLRFVEIVYNKILDTDICVLAIMDMCALLGPKLKMINIVDCPVA